MSLKSSVDIKRTPLNCILCQWAYISIKVQKMRFLKNLSKKEESALRLFSLLMSNPEAGQHSKVMTY